MALYNFPDSPSNADTVTINGITYTYNSTKGYWTSSAGSSGGGGASVSTSDSAPSSPSDGDLWYDTDDGGMFVYYADGSSNQWVEVIGQQGAAGAAGSAGADGSATVVANVTALLALSSPSAGDQAFVTATNTLYFYNGSGWYKIALINTNPSISGANAAYSLATDGTATTVTIVATDPEGLPITYSIASDTSGNIATVAQGTGASTNVWTITPSTNTAYAGTFSLTFRASDGVNIATAASSFTLQFKVANSKYTTGLFTSVGANNATNMSTWDDKSSSNHTITATGDTHQSTFSPYRHGGYSAGFDGAGDYLQIPQTSLDLGSDDFCVEAWVYTKSTANQALIGSYRYADGVGSWNLNINYNSNKLRFFIRHSSGTVIDGQFESGTFPTYAWTHVAVTRDGANLRAFINGTQAGTTNTALGSNTIDNAITTYRIGAANDNAIYWNGYIGDARVVKGSSIYTSNFTAPTDRLTAVTNTIFLGCHLPYIVDGSTNNHAITVNGDTRIIPVAPYDAKEYDSSEHSGSIVFDGTGDYLTAPNASANFGTGEFRVECWLYPNALGNVTILGNGGITLGHWSGNLQIYNGGFRDAGHDLKNNVWQHVVWQRNSSGLLETCLNGKKASTGTTDTGNKDTTSSVRIGLNPANVEPYDGSIADLRVVIGSGAAYTADFTPTTSPNTAISNTTLLLQGTDAGIIDKSQTTQLVNLMGNTKSSTTQNKFLTTSMYFDGTGDYIKADNQEIGNFGTGDFTVEGWLWVPNRSALYTVVDGRPSSLTSASGWSVAVSTAGNLYVYSNGFILTGSGGAVTTSTWHHWAFTRSGSDQKLFLNGTQQGSTYTTARDYTADLFRIGASSTGGEVFSGYQSDVRVTKGLARYTSNFSVPTAALEG